MTNNTDTFKINLNHIKAIAMNTNTTTHGLTKFTSDICRARNNKECIAACFIDLEKAFDTVWLDGLFFVLIKEKFSTHLLKILWSMLHDKKFYISEGIYRSKLCFNIVNGLQQGTVNSPILFNIYLSNLVRRFDLNNGSNIYAIAFANDFLFYIKNAKPSVLKTELESLFNKIYNFFLT